MAYPSTARAIEAQLGAIAAAHPDLCTRTPLPDASHEGRRISFLRVAGGDGGGRPVLFTGGAHAREWAPPDALLTLLERLLDAFAAGTSLTIGAFTDTRPSPDIAYPATTIAAADVRRIVERVELFVLPLINPDGRAFSQSAAANALWRKNRRPPAPGSGCVGVDVNRNHDVAWDFERIYDAAGEAAVAATKDPCDPQTYIGPAPASEPETRNVASLMRSSRAELYVDVHSFSRKILFPWGIDDNQSRDAGQNHRNPVWDGRRDGAPGGVYGEFLPNGLRIRHEQLGRAMRDAITGAAGGDARARARSLYDVEPSLSLYPATGTASDFAASLQFRDDAPAPEILAYTLECGSDLDGEGGFQPVPAIYPKIEREVHLALLAVLRAAA